MFQEASNCSTFDYLSILVQMKCKLSDTFLFFLNIKYGMVLGDWQRRSFEKQNKDICKQEGRFYECFILYKYLLK